MNNKEKYDLVFKKIFNVEVSELGANFTAESVEKWDSVTQMSLVGEIEDTFGIMLDIDDIVGLISYEEGLEILKKYSVEM